MDISNLETKDLNELAQRTEDKEILRQIADKLEITFSGNTGVVKLKEKISEVVIAKMVEETPEQPEQNETQVVVDPVTAALNQHIENEAKKNDEDVHIVRKAKVYTKDQMMEMDASQVLDDNLRRQVIRTQALVLRRVTVTNLDPEDAALPGAIITVYSKYTNKVSKYIPFGAENEHGYHLPQILVDELKSRRFPVRKEVKRQGSQFGVKQFTTHMAPKFAVTILDPLTPTELQNLANKQTASGSIDRST